MLEKKMREKKAEVNGVKSVVISVRTVLPPGLLEFLGSLIKGAR